MIASNLNYFLFSISLIINVCFGSEILAFFPFPAKSHQAIFGSVVRGLCESGHNVTLLTPFPLKSLSVNCTQIIIPNSITELQKIAGMNEGSGAQVAGNMGSLSWDNSLRKMGIGFAKIILNEPKVKKIIETENHYDLILLETTFYQEMFIALHHRFNAPVVEIMPLGNFHWTYFLHGNPYDTNYIVDAFQPFTDHMSFRERCENTVGSIATRILDYYFYMPLYQSIMDKHFRYPGWESRPPLIDMIKNTSIVLINSHIAFNYPQPFSPNFKEIGGIHLQTSRNPLPKDIQDFMDEAEHGVIYFSLGSHIKVSSTLGDNLKEEFVKAFSTLKQRVLWKWETDFINPPANVKIEKWFPQQDVLAHKNMKIFISHGGSLSVTEAVSNGLPMVGIAILGDQPKNVRHMSNFGYGIGLDFTNLTAKSISWAINEILSNTSYREKSIEISLKLKDQPLTPLKTAIFWIEYVLRHNGAHHLKPAISHFHWYQQAMFDVYLCCAALFSFIIIIFYLTVKLFIKLFFKRPLSKGTRTTKPKIN